MKILFFRFKTLLTRQKFNLLMTVVILTVGLNTSVLAQDLPVSGKITSKDGKPVPGATVIVKGSSPVIGTQTDMDGNFTINVPEALKKDGMLLVTSLGFGKQEIKVNSQSSINISLAESTVLINEVIVVGYGSQKKSDVTGAVESVKAEELQKAPVLEITQALQGRAAGVQVLPSTGAPGSNIDIRIRGTGTTGNSSPLYVVDGLPLSDMKFVNANDVETMEILKDASACAIYGARAANGVVIVTTKQGVEKNGKPTISFDASSGVQTVWQKMNLLSAANWIMLKNEAALADGLSINPLYANPASFGKGTDWQDQVFRTAAVSNYNLSVSGGTEKNKYFISGGYFKNEGIIQKSYSDRISFRVNTTQQVAPKLKFGQTLSLTRQMTNSISEGNEFVSVVNAALTIDPITQVRNPDGSFGYSQYNNIKNPLALLDNTNQAWINNRLVGGVYGEYEFIEGLKFKSNLGLDGSFGNYSGYLPLYNIGPDFSNFNNDVTRYSEQRSNVLWDNTLTYSKTFNKRHELTVLGGLSAQSVRAEWYQADRMNIQSNDPNLRYLDAATGASNASGSAYENSIYSQFGRINYMFDNKYILTANIRRDGSSRFQGDKRYGIFPSLAAAWKITNEEFMQSHPKISTLKARVGWGQIGNQDLYGVDGNYPYTSSLSGGQYYVFGGVPVSGTTALTIGNPQIQWETVTSTNFGVDGGLFDDRITFSVDYYIKNTTNMLVQVPTPGYLGLQTPPYVNGGAVLNRGLELTVGYRKDEGLFKYFASANISFVHNEVVSLGTQLPGEDKIFISSANFRGIGNVERTEVGQPIASFYGYQTDGIFQNAAEVAAGHQPAAHPGDIRFKDLNGDGKIDDKDRTFLGSPIPKFTYGFNLGGSFMNFDLSLFFQGVQGNQIFNGNKYLLESGIGYTEMSNSMLNRWTGPGTSTTMPRMTQSDPNFNLRMSDRYIEDGSYLRLKTLQFGYTLPKGVMNYAHIAKLRVYISAQNLLTFTKYKGLDPEIGLSPTSSLDIGVDRGTYPQARILSIGVNLTF